MKRAVALVVLCVALVAAAAVVLLHRLNTPYRGFSEPEVFVELPAGSSVSAIASRLAEAGVVADPVTFRIAAKLSGAERHLEAGEYRFADPATARDVAARLARGDVYVRTVTFPEGLTITEMAEIFGKSGLGTAADFQRAAADASLISAIDPDADSLEGYLFPDTYAMPRHAGASGTVHAMVSRFLHAFDESLRARAAAAHMSPRELVTLASIVERETAAPSERPLVAAVYTNRLGKHMLLQCDPTVIYAMMRAGRWKGNLSRADLEMDSPYNTYRYPGLPPGPIASPGLASIEAAAAPANVPYLYFVSRNDGTHVFASSLEEHNRNVTKWQVRYFSDRHSNRP
jgi:UPF0755 protein